MKKSNFTALVLGSISTVFFALGMCMALLPEWGTFRPGVGMGCVGLALALITLITWRKMENKEPIHITGKAVLTTIVAVIGALGLGIGMCLTMVWSQMVAGIVVGLAGIVILLMLIPICKGLK